MPSLLNSASVPGANYTCKLTMAIKLSGVADHDDLGRELQTWESFETVKVTQPHNAKEREPKGGQTGSPFSKVIEKC